MQEYMLTDRETGMLVELLRGEEESLERALDATETPSMKEQLQARLRAIDRLIDRFDDDLDDPCNA
jgi:hypothetical protein